jgi:hypothetical protein
VPALSRKTTELFSGEYTAIRITSPLKDRQESYPAIYKSALDS